MGGSISQKFDKDLSAIQQRVESWVQPMAEHEVQAVDVDTRTTLNPRSSRALVVFVVVVVLGLGVWLGLEKLASPDLPAPQNAGVDQLSIVPEQTSGSPSSSATPEPAIAVVSIQGLVRSPGLFRLAAETRIGEAVEAAGGQVPEADLSGINLAEKISDGLQILVTAEGSTVAVPGQAAPQPASGAPSSSGAAAGPGAQADSAGTIDLNSADASQLESLPGVGPATAAAIVAWRESNGKFSSVEQLMDVRGIGLAKFEALKDAVRV